LRLFSERAGIERRRYRQLVKEGVAPARRDRVGGGHEEQWSVGGDKNAWQVWGIQELGMSQETLELRLRVMRPVISLAVRRGERFATKRNWKLVETQNL